MENNRYYRQLKVMEGKTGDDYLEMLIYRGLYMNLGNELYVKDIYKLILKKVKKVKVGSKNFNIIGDRLIRSTSCRLNDWHDNREEVEKVKMLSM